MSKAISLPFSFDANGAVGSTTDQKKIIQDRVVLVVMTFVGERVMRPNYGTHIKNSLFEVTDVTSSIIKQEIDSGFTTWLPYLTLLGSRVELDSTDGYIKVTISYKYGSTANPETVVVKTDILSRSGDVIAEVPYGNK